MAVKISKRKEIYKICKKQQIIKLVDIMNKVEQKKVDNKADWDDE